MAIQSTVSPVLDMALPVPCLPAKDTHTKSLKKKTISPEPRNGNTQDGALTPSQRPTGPCTRAPADPSSGPVAPQSSGPSGQAAFKNVDHFSLERSRLRPTPLGSVSSATSEGVQPQSLSVSLSLARRIRHRRERAFCDIGRNSAGSYCQDTTSCVCGVKSRAVVAAGFSMPWVTCFHDHPICSGL